MLKYMRDGALRTRDGACGQERVGRELSARMHAERVKLEIGRAIFGGDVTSR